MIGYLQGKLMLLQPPELMIEVAGVGDELSAPMSVFYELPDIGQPVALYTHLAVSETAQSLYGFAHLKDRTLFRALIRISGVGPKLALTILSGIAVEEFSDAIEEGNEDRLVRLPGIGKKTAQRLIIEMKDPLKKLELSGGTRASAELSAVSAAQEARDALQSLGYKESEIRRMLKSVDVDGLTTADIIRLALKLSS